MNIQYYADDGSIKNLGDNELQHWKYIKKIKTGSGWRYFYTPEEVQAYYEEQKKKGYYTQRGKAKKTGKIERRMINAYRKTHPYE